MRCHFLYNSCHDFGVMKTSKTKKLYKVIKKSFMLTFKTFEKLQKYAHKI
jgi:hypothetical protein